MGDINKDDLYNMFKSYENNVKYNIQLYDRQDTLIKEQTAMIVSLGNISEKLSDLNRHLESLIKSVSDCSIDSHEQKIEIHSSIKGVKDDVSGIGTQITDLKIGGIKQHGYLKISLIAIASVLSAVVLSLVVTLEKIWSKSDIIDAVAKFIGLDQ